MSKTVMPIDTQQMVNQLTAALCSKRDLDHAEARLRDKIAKAQNQIILWVVSAVILSLVLPDFLQRLGLA